MTQQNVQKDLANLSLPPHSIEAEQAVIGACLLEPNAIERIHDFLKPECFYRPKHQIIYKAISTLFKSNKQIDIITVSQHLTETKQLERVDGLVGITSMTNMVVSSAHLHSHATIIYHTYLSRQMIAFGMEMVTAGYNPERKPMEVLEEYSRKLFEISLDPSRAGYFHISDLLVTNIQRTFDLKNRNVDLTGINTGLRPVNALTCGWQKTDLIILAARPSVGKTALALTLARNATVYSKVPVAIFSLEMSANQLVSRMQAAETGIPMDKILRGKMDAEEFAHYERVSGVLAELPIYIDDTAALTITELRTKCRRLKQQHSELGLIIVDYLQLMNGNGDKRKNREQEISEISRGLKALAKELEVPIIALSQMSRGIESRSGKEPMLSDLRESGAIEQDADVVIFIWRPDYQDTSGDPSLMGQVFVKFAKHRNGSIETLILKSDLSTQRFYSDYDHNYPNTFKYSNPF